MMCHDMSWQNALCIAAMAYLAAIVLACLVARKRNNNVYRSTFFRNVDSDYYKDLK